MSLKPQDWDLDAYSCRLQAELARQAQAFTAADITLKELIKLFKMTTYGDFRKIMRKRSEKTVERLESKY